MKNRFLKELNSLKKLSSSGLYLKRFELPYLTISSAYQHFSKDVFQIMDDIYEELKIDTLISALLSSKDVNYTEKRPALHHIYRDASKKNNDFDSIAASKFFFRHTKINSYKNIFIFGIGGSYEGPKLLSEFTESKDNIFFITGPDKDEFLSLVKPRLKEKNLYVFISKSFSTDEVLLSHSWLPKNVIKNDVFAITANKSKATNLGFFEQNIMEIPESVGGRYSIWSQVSSPILLPNECKNFLNGAASIDNKVQKKSIVKNALKNIVFHDVWSNNFLDKKNRVILSYNWKLRSLTNYLQQLEMESLGKANNPESIFTYTGQTIYGGFGPTAQHSYFQLLHQGTSETSADFIASFSSHSKLLNSQAEGQFKLLSGKIKFKKGKDAANSNIGANFFSLENLDLFSLGALIAFWEYRVFITSAMLQINPFDQFGVNAGKRVTRKILDK
jgi:glucose-6-phosphate isomerase